MTTAIETVRKYYEAFDKHDFQGARALLHDKFRFTGPMMQTNSPEEFFEKMQGFNCEFKNRMLHLVESGNTVGALLDCSFTKPFSATIRMSEWFAVENGKILSSDVIYDTRQMPAAAA